MIYRILGLATILHTIFSNPIFSVCTVPEMAADPAIVAEIRALMTAIHEEDIPMCEGVQAGLESRLWPPGPLATQEGCLPRFHAWLAERLLDGGASDG